MPVFALKETYIADISYFWLVRNTASREYMQ